MKGLYVGFIGLTGFAGLWAFRAFSVQVAGTTLESLELLFGSGFFGLV